MNKTRFVIVAATLIATVAVGSLVGPSSIDPVDKWSWDENTGWMNWRNTDSGNQGVVVADTFLAGFVWAENMGWINLGAGTPADGVHYANLDGSDFGVNIDLDTGDLFGLAWGENAGWINFDRAGLGADRARLDRCERRFLGYAWGENVGWINLNDAAHFVAVGPCDPADLDCDGVVALDDVAGFVSFLTGPDVPTACSVFDVNDDGDADLLDYATVQRVFAPAP